MSSDTPNPITPPGGESDPPHCGLCGKAGHLTRTPCCGNWICDDADQYLPFSRARNSCFHNHSTFTICSLHYHQRHQGRWQDCAECRESGPLEAYVHHATNEYNFEKLENPPRYEPTHCLRCGVRIRLNYDGFTMNSDGFSCAACSQLGNPAGSQAVDQLFNAPATKRSPAPPEYPIGTLAYYGPTNRLATKIAAAIIQQPESEPEPLHRWITHGGDIRDDAVIVAQVAAFFRRHRVRRIASSRKIIGCPHEEEKDYPLGGQCPHCPFWHHRDGFTHQLLPAGGMSAAEIVMELSNPKPRRQPIEALTAADLHREELIAPFLHALESGIANPKDIPPGEGMLFSYATYLLSKWREPRAYPLFLRWLSLPDRLAFDLGGDTVTADGSRLLASVCAGQLEGIQSLIVNREANEFARAAGIASLAILVAWGEAPREKVVDYFLWLAREGLEREASFVWDELANCSVDIEALPVFPDLRRAYEERLASSTVMEPKEFDAAEAGPRGEWLARFREQHLPITDVAAVTAGWQIFADDPFDAIEKEASCRIQKTDRTSNLSRTPPKIGRNDPCPCGSGKKYKKCCGQ